MRCVAYVYVKSIHGVRRKRNKTNKTTCPSQRTIHWSYVGQYNVMEITIVYITYVRKFAHI